jgi:predicted nucleotidyltransferase
MVMSPDPGNPRLTPEERDGIRRAVRRACAETGDHWRRILLFGSRAIPHARGGDIDLLVEIEPGRPGDIHRLARRLRLALEDEIGEQHVDLVLDDGRGQDAFAVIAREQGTELWSNT